GAGSRNGILFKGSSYLDRMTRIGTVVMDKTGTLTKGTFVVQKVISQTPINDWLPLVSALEAHSSHPTAKAIVQHAGNRAHALPVRDVEETRGAGIRGTVNGKNVIAGNLRMMERNNIRIDSEFSAEAGTIVYVAIDNLFAGALVIADEIKPDAKEAVDKLRRQNIRI